MDWTYCAALRACTWPYIAAAELDKAVSGSKFPLVNDYKFIMSGHYTLATKSKTDKVGEEWSVAYVPLGVTRRKSSKSSQ